MIRPLALAAAVSVAFMLTACGQTDAPAVGDRAQTQVPQPQMPPPPTGAEVQEQVQTSTVRAGYLCENGERLAVEFDNPRRMATIRNSSGEAVDLFQQRSADGIWYRGSGAELRGRGDRATWTGVGRQPTECRAVA